jgi:hypothetical protein
MISHFIWKRRNYIRCVSLIVLSFGRMLKSLFFMPLLICEVMNVEELCESLRDEIRPFFFTLSPNFLFVIHHR